MAEGPLTRPAVSIPGQPFSGAAINRKSQIANRKSPGFPPRLFLLTFGCLRRFAVAAPIILLLPTIPKGCLCQRVLFTRPRSYAIGPGSQKISHKLPSPARATRVRTIDSVEPNEGRIRLVCRCYELPWSMVTVNGGSRWRPRCVRDRACGAIRRL